MACHTPHMACHTPHSGIRSGSMGLLATSWAMPGTLGFLYLVLGGELRHFFIIAF